MHLDKYHNHSLASQFRAMNVFIPVPVCVGLALLTVLASVYAPDGIVRAAEYNSRGK